MLPLMPTSTVLRGTLARLMHGKWCRCASSALLPPMQFGHTYDCLQHAVFKIQSDGSVKLGDSMQDGGVLYNFEGSTGLSARLHPAAQAKLSAEDAAIWQSKPRCPVGQTAVLRHVASGMIPFSVRSPAANLRLDVPSAQTMHLVLQVLIAPCARMHAELMVAIMTLPWPISTEYPEDCRYNTLLQISIGQVRRAEMPCM
jgi:hypothetical protein